MIYVSLSIATFYFHVNVSLLETEHNDNLEECIYKYFIKL